MDKELALKALEAAREALIRYENDKNHWYGTGDALDLVICAIANLRKTDPPPPPREPHRGYRWQVEHQMTARCLGGCANDTEHARLEAFRKVKYAGATEE